MSDRSRDAVMAELRPIRTLIIQVSEHLNDDHGISLDREPEINTPEGLEAEQRAGSWLRRYAGPDVAAEYRSDRDFDLAAAMAEVHGSCDLEGCPGVDVLMEKRGELLGDRDRLRAEMPDPVVSGSAQTVTPHGLSVEALTGLMDR